MYTFGFSCHPIALRKMKKLKNFDHLLSNFKESSTRKGATFSNIK